MASDAELAAGARALHEMLCEDHTMRGCEHMAGRVLKAAEKVRAAEYPPRLQAGINRVSDGTGSNWPPKDNQAQSLNLQEFSSSPFHADKRR